MYSKFLLIVLAQFDTVIFLFQIVPRCGFRVIASQRGGHFLQDDGERSRVAVAGEIPVGVSGTGGRRSGLVPS